MIRTFLVPALLSCSIALAAAEPVRIAVVDLDVLAEVVEPIIHAKPENAATVKELTEIDAKISALHIRSDQPADQRQAAQAQQQVLYQRKRILGRGLETQAMALIVATSRATFADRFQVILKREAMNEILDKPPAVDLVDVTMDLRNALIQNAAR